jgi:hypothetical protein
MTTGSEFVCPQISADGESLQSSKGLLYVISQQNGGCVGPYESLTGALNGTNRLHKGAGQFLADHFGTQPACNDVVDKKWNACHSIVHVTSEYKRGNNLFRAHCNYRNNGPWYDWVMIRWEKSSPVTRKPECCVEYLDNPLVTQTHDYAPAQIVAFVVSPEANETVSPHIMAVVNTCSFLHKKDSVGSMCHTIERTDRQGYPNC